MERIDSEEDNTLQIAEQIFSQPPRPKCTIQLQLEDPVTAQIARTVGVSKFVSEIITQILGHGIEILWGHRDIYRLTERNFELLQEYTNSFGYFINKKVVNEPGKLSISFYFTEIF